jgi:rSAM/selenodomain-associated transferase 2
MRAMKSVSSVIPVLDEDAEIVDALTALAPFRARAVEIIVVDGGSRDRTAELARPLCDRVIAAPRGRALQMNAGAAAARGQILIFLHVDTRLPPDADRLVATAIAQTGRDWGRFDVRIVGGHVLFPMISATMNLRSRLTGIATGDQAIFVTRQAFATVGAFPYIPLMEDIAFSRRLKGRGAPICLRQHALTSGRRWRKHGVLRTILLMWRLRLAFFLGADPDRLAQRYGYGSSKP